MTPKSVHPVHSFLSFWPFLSLYLINVITLIDTTWLFDEYPVKPDSGPLLLILLSRITIQSSQLETWKISKILTLIYCYIYFCGKLLGFYLIFLTFFLFSSFSSCCVSVLTSLPVFSFHFKIFCYFVSNI